MKKLILLLTIVGLSSVYYAQSLMILDKQGLDITGDTIYLWGDVNTAILEYHPDIKNISNSAVDMKLKVVPNAVVTNSQYNYCLGNSCYVLTGSQTAIALATISIDSNSIYDETILDCFPLGQLGVGSITYVFFNSAVPSDTASITIIYNTTPVGIKGIELKENAISDIYPNPANNFASINYNLQGYDQKAKIVLYNMLGNNLKEFDIAANSEGKVNVNTLELPNGVYFYALRSSNKTITTKRLIVNH